MNIRKRLQAVRNILERKELYCCLLVKPHSIYYFSGFFPTSPAFLLIPRRSSPRLLVSSVDAKRAESEVFTEIEVTRSGEDILEDTVNWLRVLKTEDLRELSGVKRMLTSFIYSYVGVEEDAMSINLLKGLGLRKYKDISFELLKIRSIKEPEEIERIKKAVQIAEKCLADKLNKIGELSERDLSIELDYSIKREGADFSLSMVAYSEHTSHPHWPPSGSRLESGPAVIDILCTFNKYYADICRTFYLGDPPSEFRKAYNFIFEVHKECLDLARVGTPISYLHSIVNKRFSEAGYKQALLHSAGHGIGLEVHEYPIISDIERIRRKFMPKILEASLDKLGKYAIMVERELSLEKNMVLSIEIGAYFKNFGVRIEDVVVVDEEPLVLSRMPRKLESVVLK